MRKYLPLVIVLLLFATPALADYAYDDDTYGEEEDVQVIFEEFDDAFPPDGWSIQQSNPTETWKLGACPDDASCAVVQGTDAAASDEWLISAPVTANICDETYNLGVIWYYDGELWEPAADETLAFYYSYEDEDDWKLTDGQFDCRSGVAVQIALRYVATGGPGYQVEQVSMFYYGQSGEVDDDDDDNDNGANADDDDNNDNDDDNCGGCGATNQQAGSAMFGVMMFLGFLAFVLGFRRRN